MLDKWIVFKEMFLGLKHTVPKWTAKYKNNSIFWSLECLSFSEPNHLMNTSETNCLEIKDRSLKN